MKTPIIFFGTENFSLPALKQLVEAEIPVKCVITKPDAKKGRGKKSVPPAIKNYALKHGIEVHQPTDSNGINQAVREFSTELAVLVAYGRILPSSVLNSFNKGIINLHPSLLPKYRGPSPIESAILNGEDKTGVSLMKITQKMDAGPIYIQKELDLKGNETKPMLSEYLSEVGAKILVENIEGIANGDIEATEQDDSKATYTGLIKKGDGDIDWNDKASYNERKIRAYLGWPGSRATVEGNEVILLKVEVTNDDISTGSTKIIDGFPVVGCKEGSLKLIRVKPLNKAAMKGDDFVRGYLKS